MISSTLTSSCSRSTSCGIRAASSASVKPAYSLKQASEVTLSEILNPEVRESRDPDDTPVINVLAIQLNLQSQLLCSVECLQKTVIPGYEKKLFNVLRKELIGKIVIFINHYIKSADAAVIMSDLVKITAGIL